MYRYFCTRKVWLYLNYLLWHFSNNRSIRIDFLQLKVLLSWERQYRPFHVSIWFFNSFPKLLTKCPVPYLILFLVVCRDLFWVQCLVTLIWLINTITRMKKDKIWLRIQTSKLYVPKFFYIKILLVGFCWKAT